MLMDQKGLKKSSSDRNLGKKETDEKETMSIKTKKEDQQNPQPTTPIKLSDKYKSFYMTKLETPPQTSIENMEDFNSSKFDERVYLEKVLKESTFQEIIKTKADVKLEIKELDKNLQETVSTNYKKFFTASEVIKKMKNDVENVKNEMNSLNNKFMNLSESSKSVNDQLQSKRDQIRQLYKVSELLLKLSFILDLPKTMQRNLEKKNYNICLNYFKASESVLIKYPNLFSEIHKKCQSIISDLKDELKNFIFAMEDDPQLQGQNFGESNNKEESVFEIKKKFESLVWYKKVTEYLNILFSLNESKEDLRTNFIGVFRTKLESFFNQNSSSYEKKDAKEKDKKEKTSLKKRVLDVFNQFQFYLSNFLTVFKVFSYSKDKKNYSEKEKKEKNDIFFEQTVTQIVKRYYEKLKMILFEGAKGLNESDLLNEMELTFEFICSSKNTPLLNIDSALEFDSSNSNYNNFSTPQSLKAMQNESTEGLVTLSSSLMKDLLINRLSSLTKSKITSSLYQSVKGLSDSNSKSEYNAKYQSESEIVSKSKWLFGSVCDLIINFVKNCEKTAQMLRQEKVIADKMDFVVFWIGVECMSLIDFFISEVDRVLNFSSNEIDTTAVLNEENNNNSINLDNNNSDQNDNNELISVNGVGALMLSKVCDLMANGAVKEVEENIKTRFKINNAIVDEGLGKRLAQCARKSLISYISMTSQRITSVVIDYFNNKALSIKNEVTEVSLMSKIVVEEIKKSDKNMTNLFQNDVDLTNNNLNSFIKDDDSSSQKSHKSAKPLNKSYNQSSVLSFDTTLNLKHSFNEDPLLSDSSFSFDEELNLFKTIPFSHRIYGVSALCRATLKSLLESVRYLSFSSLMFQQLQLDCLYLNTELKKLNMLDDVLVTKWLNLILRDAGHRTINLIPISIPIAKSIVEETIMKLASKQTQNQSKKESEKTTTNNVNDINLNKNIN